MVGGTDSVGIPRGAEVWIGYATTAPRRRWKAGPKPGVPCSRQGHRTTTAASASDMALEQLTVRGKSGCRQRSSRWNRREVVLSTTRWPPRHWGLGVKAHNQVVVNPAFVLIYSLAAVLDGVARVAGGGGRMGQAETRVHVVATTVFFLSFFDEIIPRTQRL